MLKREWETPRTLVQEFRPNEYVATCGSQTKYLFKCDAGLSGQRYSVYRYNWWGRKVYLEISGDYYGPRDSRHESTYSFFPSYETHEVPTTDRFYSDYYLDDKSTLEDEKIEVVLWIEGGKNVHATTVSSWDTIQVTSS